MMTTRNRTTTRQATRPTAAIPMPKPAPEPDTAAYKLQGSMQTYSHSGAVPVLGALGTMVVGMLAALVGGFVYAFAFFYIPIVQLNVLLTLAFGAGLGLAVAATAHAG